ncbi:hypothetical protein GN958_ATG10139 [Phytophthora infestans]|uniref:Uncharacterized protein n=1 Tax=Phytophthora infestans TaxID=4787 RepID=A0A8S9TLT3_PHYIN|nr:hypothetical protein GN958_ATG22181 [Phytophthora infestans]KAF4140669.1 hypothetical protein GN958_ATG10139 [Phytophthora infestans]
MVQCRAQNNDEDKGAALAAVLTGASMKTTSEETNIPYSTVKAYVAASRKGATREPKRMSSASVAT